MIFEYKRARDENIINQGLFYLDWLLDHRGEFALLVQQRLGEAVAKEINWENPRLVCVAQDFTRYDEHAVQQIARSIELVRYRDYRGELLALELLAAADSSNGSGGRTKATRDGLPRSGTQQEKTVSQYLAQAPETLTNLFADLDAMVSAFGDDVRRVTNKNYFAYRRLRNFACVEVHPRDHSLLVYVKVDPGSIELEEGFTRDVRSIGHFGTGGLEIRIRDGAGLERAGDLLMGSYQAS